MDKQRQIFITEMKRIKTALEKTDSEYLKKDYIKALKRMKRELQEYDNYKKYYIKR